MRCRPSFAFLPRNFLTPLLGKQEYVIWVAQFLFPCLPHLAEPEHVVGFGACQHHGHVFIDLRLQFLRERLIEMCVLARQYSGGAQRSAMRHDIGEGEIEAVDRVIDS